MKNIFGKFTGFKTKINNPVNYFMYIGNKVFFLTNT